MKEYVGLWGLLERREKLTKKGIKKRVNKRGEGGKGLRKREGGGIGCEWMGMMGIGG